MSCPREARSPLRSRTVRAALLSSACVALWACSPEVLGRCSATADCAAGLVCDTTAGIGVCVAGCGGETLCKSGEVCTNGACARKTCVPECGANQHCDANFHCLYDSCSPACNAAWQTCTGTGAVTPPSCVDFDCPPGACEPTHQYCNRQGSPAVCAEVTDGAVTLAVSAGLLAGGDELAVSATTTAPGVATRVEFRLEQAGVAKASVAVTSGSAGVFSGALPLAGNLASGAATLFAKVYWTQGGVEKSKDSAPVAVTLDLDPPVVTAPTADRAIYSSIATPAQVATLTAQISDVGAAGVDPSTVTVLVPGHVYPPATTPVGGSGAYTFQVPVFAFGQPIGAQGPAAFTIKASDKLGNTHSSDWSIAIDNKAPGFSNFTLPAGFLGPDSTIALSVDVVDPAGGAGLVPSSVKLGVAGGGAPAIAATGSSGPTFTFSPLPGDLQAANTQGPVSLAFAAADAAGNVVIDSTQALLIDLQAPTVGPLSIPANPATGSNGWYAYDGSGASKVAVTLAVDDGASGSGAASATLALGSFSATQTASTGGTVRSYTFQVPTSVGAKDQEVTLVATTVTGKDKAGNSGTTASAATLRIDGLGPSITGVTVNGGGALPSGGQSVTTGQGTFLYFRQLDTAPGGNALAPIDLQATIQDGGSGVAPSSVKLVLASNGTTPVDAGVVVTPPTAGAPDVWHFSLPRVNAQISKGSQGVIQFKVLATDNLGNPQQADGSTPPGGGGPNASTGQVGIDGQLPALSFSIAGQYPVNATGCDSSAAYLTSSLVCGHDGARFWRGGDDGSSLYFTALDGASGSGMSPSGASCAAPGQTSCTVNYNAANQHFEFAANPSQWTEFTSDANGRGTATVTVTARDLVGNVATAQQTVNVTRFLWARTLPLGKVRTAPVVTPPIGAGRVLLVGGDATGPAGLTTTVAALNQRGGVLGGAAGGAITNDLVYSPATRTLYAAAEGGQKVLTFVVSGTGLTAGYACDLGTGKTINGAPALVSSTLGGVQTEFALVTESSAHRLWALTGSGGACDTASVLPVTVGVGVLRSPKTDGGNVFAAYQNTGLAKVAFANGAFGAPVLKDLAFLSPLGGPALVGGALFMTDTKNYQGYTTNFSGAVTGLWVNPTVNGRMSANATASPVINGALLAGVADSNDGSVRFFNTADGSPAFSYATAGANSQVAIGGDANAAYYFTSSDGALYAIARVGSTASATLAPRWSTAFTGSAGAVPFTGTGSPATLASSGVLYFGADNGTVYAIATDSPGAATPTGGSNWPRAGFDNCNSSNSSLTNCQ
jgi:hypothetical protein